MLERSAVEVGTICVIAILVLMSFVPAGAMARPAAEGHRVHEWKAVVNGTGDLAMRLTVVTDANAESNECIYEILFAGRVLPGNAHQLHSWAFNDAGWGIWSEQTSVAQAHAGPVDSRQPLLDTGLRMNYAVMWTGPYAYEFLVGGGGGGWVTGLMLEGEFAAVESWTLAGVNLAPMTNPFFAWRGHDVWPSFSFHVTCSLPFEVVDMAAGQQVVGFSARSMQEGAGAATAVPVGLSLSTALSVADTAAVDLKAESAWLTFRADPTVVGRLSDRHAAGEEMYQMPGLPFAVEAVPSGPHTVQWTGLSNGVMAGMLLGLHPISAVDELPP